MPGNLMILALEKQLEKRQMRGNLRTLTLPKSRIDFASNDYLGLARCKRLAHSVWKEWQNLEGSISGLGATGSRLLTGNTAYAQELEDKIARFHGYSAGLLFNCGYMANVGLLAMIAESNDTILFDAHAHASLRDGIRLSRAQAYPFRHNNCAHLENRLKECSVRGNRYICIESVYSTDGSIAPLKEICLLARSYQAHLIVDEAHAVGIYGPSGSGLVAQEQLQDDVFALVVTFGKAVGCYGAAVLSSPQLKMALINFATSYIYTTALPFHNLAAIKCSYEQFPAMEQQRRHVAKLIQLCRGRIKKATETAIQPIEIKGNRAVKEMSMKLSNLGFDIRPLLSPTVQQGYECLRLTLHAFNTEPQLHALLEAVYE